MYKHVPRSQITDALMHIRALHRQVNPSNEREQRSSEAREATIRDLVSNLRRTGEHPTLKSLLEIADSCALTLDAAHQLFGYRLSKFHEYDLRINSGYTHILEDYPFARDEKIELPFEMRSKEAFESIARLDELVLRWQADVALGTVKEKGWRGRGTFYVHVGTEDSFGSSIPPGSLALVEPIEKNEEQRPNPRRIYLLQFGHGYRCARCVVTPGKLRPISTGREYLGREHYLYPGEVRIVGRIRMFALGLPVPENKRVHGLRQSNRRAALVLPWEQPSRDGLLRTEHLRFTRRREEVSGVREFLRRELSSRFSERSERRYRRPSASEPHVDGLIYLSLLHMTRYTDLIRAGGYRLSDRNRYSLESLLASRSLEEARHVEHLGILPKPQEAWEALRADYLEWPLPLSTTFPRLSQWGHKVIRMPHGTHVAGLDPPIGPGSWMLLEKNTAVPDVEHDRKMSGWSRPIYVLRRGLEYVCGFLEREGSQFALSAGESRGDQLTNFHLDELTQLSRVAGVAVPI